MSEHPERVVMDTEPIVAFLTNEPGHERVGALLDQADAGDAHVWMAEINAAEVLYVLGRLNGDDGTPTEDSLREADRTIRALGRHGLTLTDVDWRRAGAIKAHGGLSLADAFAVALAVEMDATLMVGADSEFDDVEADVTIERIRDGT